MPFVDELAGPHEPVLRWPAREPNSLRRTSTIDTARAVDGLAHVDLRARDIYTTATGTELLGDTTLRAQLRHRRIQEIAASPPESRLDKLVGASVGPGFRSTLLDVLPDQVGQATRLHLLLDDWPGAALVSGYADQHAAITIGNETDMDSQMSGRLRDICAGFASNASVISYISENHIMPATRGPRAPAVQSHERNAMHPVDALPPHSMRRLRRLDVQSVDHQFARFDAHFRDSHVDRAGTETVVHEYTVTGEVETHTRTITQITSTAQVLPWRECPGAVASANRVEGVAIAELRRRVRHELVGDSTCTHLNDMLRSLGDLDPLLDHLRSRTHG